MCFILNSKRKTTLNRIVQLHNPQRDRERETLTYNIKSSDLDTELSKSHRIMWFYYALNHINPKHLAELFSHYLEHKHGLFCVSSAVRCSDSGVVWQLHYSRSALLHTYAAKHLCCGQNQSWAAASVHLNIHINVSSSYCFTQEAVIYAHTLKMTILQKHFQI